MSVNSGSIIVIVPSDIMFASAENPKKLLMALATPPHTKYRIIQMIMTEEQKQMEKEKIIYVESKT